MDIEELFSEDGILSAGLDSYRPRRGQIEMAKTAEQSLDGGHFVLEAGTGIGKTFAYLVPLIRSGKTALISTAARALQDQLSQRDIPLLAKTLNRPVRIAVLKGRGNYLCRLALEEPQSAALLTSDGGDHWRAVQEFAARTDDGDIRGAADIPADAPVWAAATSTRESCTTQACKHYDRCFLYKARARARQADIVIVNHHLFLSDVRLKDEGVADILPSRELILFDEAHVLPQLASQYFGENLSTARLLRTLIDGERVAESVCEDPAPIVVTARRLRGYIGGLLDRSVDWREPRRAAADALANEQWRRALMQLRDGIARFAESLAARAGDHERLKNLALRVAADEKLVSNWLADGEEENEDVAAAADNGDDTVAELERADSEKEPLVRWLECEKSRITLQLAPISGRTIFAKQWEKMKTVIFTSATLSINGDFKDFCEAVGLSDTAQTRHWDSPYDFARRALLYTPPNLPDTNDTGHTAAVVKAALPLIQANAGRAFVLFSSWRALNEAADLLRAALHGQSFEIFKQGDAPNDELLHRFRNAQNGVLMGSQSFWQGVDVKGEALSLVIVDKIPFTPPNDPLLKARDAWRKKRGENAFQRNQLPPAVTLMKQVAGRLMRDYDDYGVFMVGDTRLLKRSYGKVIINALPPMRHVRDEPTAVDFLRQTADAPPTPAAME